MHHPRCGEPTFFAEKILKSFWALQLFEDIVTYEKQYQDQIGGQQVSLIDIGPKYHTIRAGNRFSPGDWFSPRVWSGRPYRSKQIIVAPDIEVKKVFGFEICGGEFIIEDRVYRGESESDYEALDKIALNDGLNRHDLLDWFKYPKPTGQMQIICWNEQIEY